MQTKKNYVFLRFAIVRRRMTRSGNILCRTLCAQCSTSSLHATYNSLCLRYAYEEKLCFFTFCDRTPQYGKIWRYSLHRCVRTTFNFIFARHLYKPLPAIGMHTKNNCVSLRSRTPPYDKIWRYPLHSCVRTTLNFIVARQLYLSLPAKVMYTKKNYVSLRFAIVRRRMERSEDILCTAVSAQRSTSSLHANYTSPCLR